MNLVFTFGEDFPVNPRHTRARPILAAENKPTEEARTDRLHAAALAYLETQR